MANSVDKNKSTSQYSIAEARNHFTELVREAEEGKAVALTRRGQPVAVILSMRSYRRLASGGSDFWHALVQYRKHNDLVALGLGHDIFDGVRDRTLGRENID